LAISAIAIARPGGSLALVNECELQVIRHVRQSYPESVAEQERRVAEILAGRAMPCLILTEHDPVYTIGTSGRESDILRREIDGVPIAVHPSGRGGEVTYHGPGQLVCYVIADLRQSRDLHRHVSNLEAMMINTLRHFGITASRNPRGIGVWVGDKKIAAVGVRCRKWITFHGIALNINPDLRHFTGIVACGMHDSPVTSMHQLGIKAERSDVEAVITRQLDCFTT